MNAVSKKFLAGVAGVSLLLAGCDSFSDADPAGPVFVDVPWEGQETMIYDLKQRDYVYGRCTLETNPGDDGHTRLNELCQGVADEEFRDDSVVVVDSETLVPVESTRVNSNTDKNERTTRSSDYRPQDHEVLFESVTPNDVFEAARDLPEASDDVPEPTYYDDEALFWLVRGIDLEEGNRVEYTNVNISTVTVFNVDLIVEELEEIEVDAGTFDAWKIRIETDSNTNEIWVDAEAPHRVVKAEIERFTYELSEVVASEDGELE